MNDSDQEEYDRLSREILTSPDLDRAREITRRLAQLRRYGDRPEFLSPEWEKQSSREALKAVYYWIAFCVVVLVVAGVIIYFNPPAHC